MNTLIIDTSTEVALIAAASNDNYRDASALTGTKHTTTIMQNIDKCLAQLHMPIHKIELIGVGIGPGSFTGIRIAVTTARMLAHILNCPLIGIKSPLLYAVSTEACLHDYTLIAFDAKKHRVFGAVYQKTSGVIPQVIIEPGDYPIETLLKGIPNDSHTLLIGDGINNYLDSIATSLKRFSVLPQCMPNGRRACDLVRYLANNTSEPLPKYYDILPFYARKSDAEIMKELRQ